MPREREAPTVAEVQIRVKVNSVGVDSVCAARRELVVRGQAGVWVLPAVRDRCRGTCGGALMAELGRGFVGLVELKLARSEVALPGGGNVDRVNPR
jgi:hypothetical protein